MLLSYTDLAIVLIVAGLATMLYWLLTTRRQVGVLRREIRETQNTLSRLIQAIESGRQLALIGKKAKKRRKRRYIVFQVATGSFNEKDVAREIIRQFKTL